MIFAGTFARKTVCQLVFALLLICLCHASVRGQDANSSAVQDFDSIQLYTLTNDNGMTVKITNYGAVVTSIIVPDRNGQPGDVALGYNRVEDYMNAVDKPYFGSIAGRVCNRIAGGQFTLDGQTYQLAKNNGDHHLHGGVIGFDKVVWDAEFDADSNSLTLSYLAKDGEEGYPGNLQVTTVYTLTVDNELVVDISATTDKATPFNPTHHTYFNLKGEGQGDILEHEIEINASQFTPTDAGGIPTGELRNVADTPLDFTSSKPIGQDINADNEQLKFARGYDQNFVLNKDSAGELSLAARVIEPDSGRVMEVRTTEPGLHFYTGNYLDGRLTGKSGKSYEHRGGFCLEAQHFPDSPNQPSFPSIIVRPGEKYESRTVYAFSTK